MTDPLPEYSDPPVSEVAMAVVFAPIQGWSAAHGGLYWNELRAGYPRNEVHPPIISQIEKFGDERWLTNPLSFIPFDPNQQRFWFLNEDGGRIVQVQRDSFVFNWRRVTETEKYPRYEATMRPSFEKELASFMKYVETVGLGKVHILQCELTYVNDIFQGKEWNEFSEALNLFSPWWKVNSTGFLPPPSTLSINAAFDFPNEPGRLHLEGRHVRRLSDEKEVFQLKFTARGKPGSPSLPDVLGWMDMAREWIVRGFTDVTSEHAHNLWGRK